MPNASNSQVMDYLTCATKWKFAHHPEYNYEPVSLGPALTRGIIGHKALEFYYSEVMNGTDRVVASRATYKRLMDRAAEFIVDPDKSQMYVELAKLLGEYFEFYDDELDYLEPIGVEILLEMPEWDFVGRADVVFRDRRYGKIVPYDHKFTYNFWPDVALQLNAQMPKYIASLRNMFPDEIVEDGIINQLRHRSDATSKFDRVPVVPSDSEMLAIMSDHKKVAEKIAKAKELSRSQIDVEATRSMTKFNCEYCNFWTLCKAQLQNQDTTHLERLSYASNSYGYEDKND